MWAGLVRLGWPLPTIHATLAITHGPLMVSGFLGTLVSLERAVALGHLWTYAAPLLTGLGGLALIVGQPGAIAPLMITLGSLGLVAVFGLIVHRQPSLHTVTMGLGALAWLTGNMLWLAGASVHAVVTWWAGFLLLTIAGERLELARLARLSPGSRAMFLTIVGFFLLGLAVATTAPGMGIRLAGAAMMALAFWLIRYDIARCTVRQAGLSRFIALSLLFGYAWLGVSGLLWLGSGGTFAGPWYDAMLHTFFLGFVISMIFGHAPIIFPAVLLRPMLWRPAFYGHLLLLHLSLGLRVAGDLATSSAWRRWGGLLNVAAMLVFLVNTLQAAWSRPGAKG